MARRFPFFLFFLIVISISDPGCNGTEQKAQTDSDHDGIVDSADNCPNAFNPHQTDTNGNGVGEVCEPFDPLDGHIQCDFPPCTLTTECGDFLDQCPGANTELQFTGQTVSCCDGACTVILIEKSVCPAGTCFDSAPHCSIDGDCPGGFPGSCFEGCCIPPPPQCPSGIPCDPNNPSCPPNTTCQFDDSIGMTCCV